MGSRWPFGAVYPKAETKKMEIEEEALRRDAVAIKPKTN